MSDIRWSTTGSGVRFESDLIAGEVIADGSRFQVAGLTWKPLDLVVDTGMALAPYRLLARDAWMGEVRQMAHTMAATENGVRVSFGPCFAHQAALDFQISMTRSDALDVTVDIRPLTTYPDYELLISAYLAEGFRPGAYIGPGVRGVSTAPRQVRPTHDPVYEDMYLAFPKDERSAAILSDGRWQRGRHFTRFAPVRYHAAPVAFSAHEDSTLDVLLMGLPQDVFSVSMAYHADDPDDDVGQHRSLYLSLLGRDVHPGERLRTSYRLQLGAFARSQEDHLAAVSAFLRKADYPAHLDLDT